MKKIDSDAPHEVLLVVDAGTGQNALNQAVEFHNAVGLTGIALTKLDGTAKGGIIFAIADRLGVPIRFIGVGEGIEDLRPFDADEFVNALFPAIVEQHLSFGGGYLLSETSSVDDSFAVVYLPTVVKE